MREISSSELEFAEKMTDEIKLIKLNKKEKSESCIKSMLMGNFTLNDFNECKFSYIFHTNYIIKLTDNVHLIHIVKPLKIVDICNNKIVSTHTFNCSGILEANKECKIKIDNFEIKYIGQKYQKEIICTEYTLNETIGNYHRRAGNPETFLHSESIQVKDLIRSIHTIFVM